MLHRSWFRTILLAAGLVAGSAFLLYRSWLAGLPDPRQPLARACVGSGCQAESILILDRQGRTLYEAIDPNGSKNVPLPLAEIPLACQQATIATEDSHFYTHPGVDLWAIGRAAWQNLWQGRTVSGGSTLSQQLARNLFLDETERTERTLRRKLREAWLAWRLEQRYSKDEILALYLNTTYYGHFAVGIEAAAQAYFGMAAAELDTAQCALLAGLPQYPAGYNPIENPEAAKGRQGVVLDLMVRQGYLSETDAKQVYREQLAYASTPFPIEAPHFVMYVQAQLESLLSPEQLRHGGLRVYTTLELDWQQRAESIVQRRLEQLRPCAAGAAAQTCDSHASPSRRIDSAALVALDPADGAVRALVGSPDYFNSAISGAVNAALSLRQPGSAIKPLTYAAAFDPALAAQDGRAPWTPATLISDIRTAFVTQEGTPYVPQNYDMVFHGPVTVRAALANSYNIPAVKTLQYIGVGALVDQAARLGIPWNLAPQRAFPDAGAPSLNASALSATSSYGLALTLGGGEVRLLDLVAAYAAFANDGNRVTPYAIEKIKSLAGEVLWDKENAGSEVARDVQAVDPRVAFLITDILSDEHARLPAFGPGNVLEIGRPAAVKTGTTTDWRDNWTVGYTPNLVAGVWVGNPDNTPMIDVSGITGAGPIWHDFMVAVLRDRPPLSFLPPDGLVQVEVCADSGLLPGDDIELKVSALTGAEGARVACPHRRLEWFIAGTEPKQIDNMHRTVEIDIRTGRPADPSTSRDAIGLQTLWVLPDELQAWARENGVQQPPVAARIELAHRSNAEGRAGQPNSLASSVTLRLASPDPNRSYQIDPGLPLASQRIPVTAQPGPELEASGSPITLLLNGEPWAEVTAPAYTAWWPLTRGTHTLQAVAITHDGSRRASEEVTVYVE